MHVWLLLLGPISSCVIASVLGACFVCLLKRLIECYGEEEQTDENRQKIKSEREEDSVLVVIDGFVFSRRIIYITFSLADCMDRVCQTH